MQQQRSNVHTQSAASSFLSGWERTLLITKTTAAEHAPASHTRRGIECDSLCPLLVCFVARAQATAVNSPPATGKAKDPTSGSLAGPESPGYGPIPGAVTGTAGPLWPCQWGRPRPGQTPSRPRAAVPASGPPSDKPAAGVGDREGAPGPRPAVNSTPGACRPATRWRPVRRGMLRIAEWQGLSSVPCRNQRPGFFPAAAWVSCQWSSTHPGWPGLTGTMTVTCPGSQSPSSTAILL
jgi:hypothetical protein